MYKRQAHTKVKWIEETTNYVGDTGTALWMPKTVTSNYGAHLAEIEVTDNENHILSLIHIYIVRYVPPCRAKSESQRLPPSPPREPSSSHKYRKGR